MTLLGSISLMRSWIKTAHGIRYFVLNPNDILISNNSRSLVHARYSRRLYCDKPGNIINNTVESVPVSPIQSQNKDIGEHCRNTYRIMDENPERHIIWVDCEMTGLDEKKDQIMEVACIITNSSLKVVSKLEPQYIHVEDSLLNNMNEWCTEHHGASGLTELCRTSMMTLAEADTLLSSFVAKYTPPGKCPMAGNSIHCDRSFILRQLPMFHSHFSYRNVDVSSIKELATRWFPNIYAKMERKKASHRALDDILESISELQFYRDNIFVKKDEQNSDQLEISS